MVTRADVVNGALQLLPSRVYLEIGVSEGETFFAVNADKKVAVDPVFGFSVEDAKRNHEECEFHQITSDGYFSEVIDPEQRFDVIYLDGMHTFEQTLRDFTNAIHFLKPDGIIVIDDVVPNSYQAALPSQLDAFNVKDFTGSTDNSWMGDTYKLVFFLRAFVPTYEVRTVADNHGQAVVWRRPRANRAIPAYSVGEIAGMQFIDVVKQQPLLMRMKFADIAELIRSERALGKPSSGLAEHPLRSLAVERMMLAKPCELRLPCATVYENVSEAEPAFAAHLKKDVYAERTARLDSVELVRLKEATVYPGADYIATSNGALIAEQISALATPEPKRVPDGAVVETVGAETVLIARYGALTWGHWLGELLPKLVMTEAAFPGRFSFAVPATHGAARWQSMRDSIVAYGVEEGRLLLLEPDRAYKLANAWAVTPVWSDHILHPAAVELMRAHLQPQAGRSTPNKVALVRPANDARRIENWDEIADLLAARGFSFVDPTQLSFGEQVQSFGAAETVFGTLGSGLTGLIYAPEGVRVLSVAPYSFGDRFFYALALACKGTYADVRGPVQQVDPHITHRSSFIVDRRRVEAALDALAARHRVPVLPLRYAAFG
jgi:hypothetical protein